MMAITMVRITVVIEMTIGIMVAMMTIMTAAMTTTISIIEPFPGRWLRLRENE